MDRAAIVVTGGEGLLGRSLAAISSSARPIVALGRAALDITDSRSVAAALDAYRPHAVINAAAITDVDGCERDPERAHMANTEGPRIVAEECARRDIQLVHVSTDFVFDGAKRTPYTQDDSPRPISVYGRTKLEGEMAVRRALPGAIIVRTSWVFGEGGKNFASRLFEFASKSTTLKGITDMTSLPTYAPDLAARLLELLDRGVAGTYQVTGSGPEATWFDVARYALDVAGRKDVTLLPISVRDLGLSAPRPPYSVMTCLLTERLGLGPLRDWREAVVDFVRLVA